MTYRRHLKRCQYRRKRRRYWLCGCPIWFDARLSGHRVHKSMGLTDWEQAQTLAQKWLRDGRSDAALIVPLPKHTSGPMTLVKAWAEFLSRAKARKLSPATIYKYDLLRRRMESFAERHGIDLLQQFDLNSLETFQGEWLDGALASLKKLERLKAFFRAAFMRRWIDENPAENLRGPKPRHRPTLPFTQDEMTIVLDAISRYPDKSGKTGRANAARIRAFVLLLRYTGLRIGDATSLSIEKLTGNKIFLYTHKTGQPVYCVIPEFVADALGAVPRLSENYFFWTGNSTLHTVVGSWQRTLRQLFNLAGVAHGYAHRFRDTFAVELLLAGVPTEEVATLLGHSNIKITQEHYSPWVRARQRQLETNLERAWSRDPIVLLQKRIVPDLSLKGSALPN